MSLRDQLLKAGIVDKKQVDKANRKLKKKRRKDQSGRDRKSVIETQRLEKKRTEALAQKEAKRTHRDELRSQREQVDRGRLVGNLVRSYGQSIPEGRQPFFHRSPQGPRINRLMIPLQTALDLRAGKLAIGWAGEITDPRFFLLPATAARRIQAHDAAWILFFNDSPPDPQDLSEKLAGMDRLPAQRNR